MNNKSSVCLIAKNEAPYLLEWVTHYIAMGFDEIVIYDDLSSDTTETLLKRFHNCGLIKYVKWPGEIGESPQMSAYRHAAKKTRCQYIAFFDADEFLVLHDFIFVNDFLAKFDNHTDVGAIAFNWRMFGDNGLEKADNNKLLRDRFTRCDIDGNGHLKSFTRLDKLVFVNNMHICDVDGKIVHPSGKEITMSNFGVSDEIELKHGQVNHYFCKTYEEYLIKKARGVADVVVDNDGKYEKYDDKLFQCHNRNEAIDDSINKNREIFNLVYETTSAIANGTIGGLFAIIKIGNMRHKLQKITIKTSH